MSTWDYWFRDVLVHTPGAPNPLVEQAVCRAAREFFQRTRAWVEWLDPTTTRAAENGEYSFELPSQAELVRPEQATRNGNPFDIVSYRVMPADPTRYDSGVQAVVTRDLETFVLVGTFSAGDAIQVQVSLRPTKDATGIPVEMASRYLEEIAEGAKAILLATPKTEFTDLGLAAVARTNFEKAIGKCAVRAYMGHTNNVPRAKPRWC